MANGKGDRNRVTDKEAFRDNYDSIDWSDKNEDQAKGLPSGSDKSNADVRDEERTRRARILRPPYRVR